MKCEEKGAKNIGNCLFNYGGLTIIYLDTIAVRTSETRRGSPTESKELPPPPPPSNQFEPADQSKAEQTTFSTEWPRSGPDFVKRISRFPYDDRLVVVSLLSLLL